MITTSKLRYPLVVLFILLWAISTFAAEKVSETKLSNGLTVLIKEVHAAPVVVVDAWYKVGSRNEGPGLTGASHLLEHMTYKGTKEFAKDDMRNLTKRNGALDNGATFYDYTHYYTTIASDRLELVLRMEASRMQSALIQQSDLNSEMTVVRSELEGRENSPGTLLFQELMSTAYRVHAYRWPVVGWRADVEHVDAEQLRKYYHTYYLPNNATLVIVGDVDTAHALALVQKHFGIIKAGVQPPQWTTPEPPQSGERHVVVHRQGKVPMEMLAWHVPAVNHQDIPALSLLEQILGSGRLSRLYQQVVEKQIGVSAWASMLDQRDSGVFIAGGAAAPGQSLAPIEKTILSEIERIKTVPPTAEEVKRALRQFEAAMIFDRDSVTDQAEQLGESETVTGDWRYQDTLFAKMQVVKPEDISHVAKVYLTENNRTIAIFQPVTNGTAMAGKPDASPANYRSSASFNAMAASTPATGNTKAQPALRKRFVLPNGLVLIVQENHANPTVAISASLKAGKAYDPTGKAGTADMVANLLDRGTTTRSSNQIATEMENAAASVETGTGWETVGVHGKALSGDTELLLRNIADLLRNANFPQAEIDKIREQMLSNLDMERDQPSENARRALYRAIYPAGHPYRLSSFDEETAGIKAIAQDDLLSFYHARYAPQTAIIAVVGDIKVDDVQRWVEKYFGDWQGSQPAILNFSQPVELHASRVITTIPDKSEVDIYVGHAGQLQRESSDYYAAEVMNMILGGGGALNSRLGNVIRDQNGLAYTVDSDFHASTGAGPWYAALGVNPKNVDKAIPLLRQEIVRMRDNGVTQQEVSDVVAYITGAYAITLQTNTALASALMDAEYFHLGLDYPEHVSTLYRAVTVNQVNAAAKKYLHPDQLTVSIAGTYEEK